MSVLDLQMETWSSQELSNKNSTISTHQQRHIIRGKRTKRPRPSTIVTSSSSTGCSGHSKNEAYFSTPSSPTSSSQNNSTCTEEDEDMANCLILLAQSGATCANLIGKKLSDPATSASYLYKCKTCNRNFATFQALGGHRASHKKPRIVPMAIPMENNKNNIVNVTTMSHKEEQVHVQFDNLQSGATIIVKAKIHECSICGSEFPSGQALGGHMRRHRTTTTTTTTNIGINTNFNIDDDDGHRIKPIRNIVQFDLNLPAPEDDHVYSKFPFVLPGPTLVGCLNQEQETRPD